MMALGERRKERKKMGDNNSAGKCNKEAPMSVARGD
jgi:hypothetical protein